MSSRRLGALASLLVACTQAPPAQPPSAARLPPEASVAHGPAPIDRIALVFSACVAGQLVPCGCSPDQRGGLPRAAAYLKQLRASGEPVIYVDAGDLLFDKAGPQKVSTQHELKARTLAQGAALLGAAARGVGARDLALGPAFVRETAGDVPLIDGAFMAEARGLKIGLVQARDAASLGERAREIRARGARLVVAIVHPAAEPWASAQVMLPQAQLAGIDLVVLGSRDDPATDPNLKAVGPPPLLAVEGHGQSLLRVDVHLGRGPLVLAPSAADRDEELKALRARIERFRGQLESSAPQRRAQIEAKIRELQERQRSVAQGAPAAPKPGTTWAEVSFVPLTKELGDDEAAQKLVAAYDDKVAELNLAEAKRQPESCPPPARGEPSFVGASKCVACHQDATRFWKETRHSHAYATLEAVKKQFSLDCIQCHVTGWQQPGGVCRIDSTEAGGPAVDGHGLGRRDVQCEACHGPGSAHVADGTGAFIRREVPAAFCMRCHEPANSPQFNDAKYRPFVVGPGHGAPLAGGQKPVPPPGTPLDR